MIVDLNADLGEGCANDQALLQLVSSANIACGFHAGDAQTMRQSVRWALQYGVAIGAHPSFPDRENFGRTRMQLPPETVYAQVVYQLGALAAIARAEGGVMVLVGLAGSELIRAGEKLGLTTRQEVFADRGYQADGTLVPRGLPGALIEDDEQALAQTLEMVRHHRVRSVDGVWAAVQAETVCLHGDGEHALAYARKLRDSFVQQGIRVSAEQ
jgi:UPF0271 protein